MASYSDYTGELKKREEATIERHWGLPRLIEPRRDHLERHVAELNLPTDYSFRDPKALVGIEVEIENIMKIDPNIPLALWMVKDDGSLRNHGREFVTHPIPASFSLPALHLLLNGLNRDYQFSKRTSIHVHLNVRNMTASQLLGSLLVYHTIEPLLFDFVGGNRINNIFCVPWTNSELFQFALGDEDKHKILMTLRGQSEKYTALNLLPIETFGTVEFRHMPGNNDIKKIVRWIDIITSLRLHGLKYPLNQIYEEIIRLNTNSQYDKFLENVFGPELKALFNPNNLFQSMERQVLDIKTCLLGAKFHKKKVNVDFRSADFINSGLVKFFKTRYPEFMAKGKTKKSVTATEMELQRMQLDMQDRDRAIAERAQRPPRFVRQADVQPVVPVPRQAQEQVQFRVEPVPQPEAPAQGMGAGLWPIAGQPAGGVFGLAGVAQERNIVVNGNMNVPDNWFVQAAPAAQLDDFEFVDEGGENP